MSQSKTSGQTITAVRDFWEQNVCGEHYLESECQGSHAYFETITQERYRWHYHLPDFLDEVARHGSTVLEIGCGMGIDSSELVKRGLQVTSIDLTHAGIRLAQQNFQRVGLTGNFQVGNAEALHFADNSFDCVYSFGVLHHTPSTEQAIREVKRVLKPDGYAFIMLYSRYSLNYVVHRLLNRPFEYSKNSGIDAPVTRAYSRKELQELFTDFDDCSFQKRYLIGGGYKPIVYFVPRFVHNWGGRLFGWHWLIRARKS